MCVKISIIRTLSPIKATDDDTAYILLVEALKKIYLQMNQRRNRHPATVTTKFNIVKKDDSVIFHEAAASTIHRPPSLFF